MAAIQRLQYVCRISLPGNKVEEVVVKAYSPTAAKQILINKYPNARGVLVLKTV